MLTTKPPLSGLAMYVSRCPQHACVGRHDSEYTSTHRLVRLDLDHWLLFYTAVDG